MMAPSYQARIPVGTDSICVIDDPAWEAELRRVPPQAWDALARAGRRELVVEDGAAWCGFDFGGDLKRVAFRVGADRSAEAWCFHNFMPAGPGGHYANSFSSIHHTGVGRVLKAGPGARLPQLMGDRLGMFQAFMLSNHTFADPVISLGSPETRKAELRHGRFSRKKHDGYEEALRALAIICRPEPARGVLDMAWSIDSGRYSVIGYPEEVARSISTCFKAGPRFKDLAERLLRPFLPYATRLDAGYAPKPQDRPMMMSQHGRVATVAYFVGPILNVPREPTSHELLSAYEFAHGVLRRQRMEDGAIDDLIEAARHPRSRGA